MKIQNNTTINGGKMKQLTQRQLKKQGKTWDFNRILTYPRLTEEEKKSGIYGYKLEAKIKQEFEKYLFPTQIRPMFYNMRYRLKSQESLVKGDKIDDFKRLKEELTGYINKEKNCIKADEGATEEEKENNIKDAERVFEKIKKKINILLKKYKTDIQQGNHKVMLLTEEEFNFLCTNREEAVKVEKVWIDEINNECKAIFDNNFTPARRRKKKAL